MLQFINSSHTSFRIYELFNYALVNWKNHMCDVYIIYATPLKFGKLRENKYIWGFDV